MTAGWFKLWSIISSGCDAALAAGLAQPAIVRARGVLRCESERESMSVAAGVWWRDVLGLSLIHI